LIRAKLSVQRFFSNLFQLPRAILRAHKCVSRGNVLRTNGNVPVNEQLYKLITLREVAWLRLGGIVEPLKLLPDRYSVSKVVKPLIDDGIDGPLTGTPVRSLWQRRLGFASFQSPRKMRRFDRTKKKQQDWLIN